MSILDQLLDNDDEEAALRLFLEKLREAKAARKERETKGFNMTDDKLKPTQADRDAEAAFDRHIVDTVGWTKFASMQTAASGAEYSKAFKAGYCAATDTQVSKHSELADRLEALHNAAKGREFDLTPADGPIAQLTLFMHENAAAVIAALRQAPEVSSLVSALERIATVDMGGGFLGAQACRQIARAALDGVGSKSDA